MTYRWVIDKDHYAEPHAKEGTNLNAKGIEGPNSKHDLSLTINDNMGRFSMYDDDDQCVYEGRIWGRYDGFEPLDDYGTPNFGCTKVKLDGEWL